MDGIAREMKEEIVRRRGEITAARRPETSGLDLCMALTGVVDHAVRIAYETVAERSRRGLRGRWLSWLWADTGGSSSAPIPTWTL